MLAELFMLRLEVLSRMNARTSEAGAGARFVPVKLAANPAKPASSKVGEPRTGG